MIENIVQDRIGHAEYGMFAALYALGFLFISLTDFGLNLYTAKRASEEPENLKEMFSNILSFKILLSLLYPVFMTGVGYLLGYNLQELYFLAILCFTQAVFQVLLFFRSAFQARQNFRIDSIVSVADKLILLLIVLFTIYNRLNLEIYIYSRLIAAIITLAIFYLVVLNMLGKVKLTFNSKKLKQLLIYSIPFAVMTILYSINEKVDQLMLERIGDITIARVRSGLYAGAYRWVDIFQMYLWTISPFFFARFAHYHKEPENLQKVFNMGQVITALPMAFAAVFVFFHADKLFWLFGNSSAEELEIMTQTTKVLFLSVFINGFFAIYGILLSCFGHEKKLSLFIVASIILNVGLNFVFIPKYGTLAAAWSTLVSVIFLSVCYIFMVAKLLPLQLPYDVLGKILIACSALIMSFFFLEYVSSYWYLNTILAGLLLMIVCYFLGIFRYIRQNV